MTDVLEAPVRPAFANFVGGEWRPSRSGATYEKHGPWRPSETVGEFPRSDADDVDDAVRAAAGAFPTWSRLSGAARGEALRKAADAVERRINALRPDCVHADV